VAWAPRVGCLSAQMVRRPHDRSTRPNVPPPGAPPCIPADSAATSIDVRAHPDAVCAVTVSVADCHVSADGQSPPLPVPQLVERRGPRQPRTRRARGLVRALRRRSAQARVPRKHRPGARRRGAAMPRGGVASRLCRPRGNPSPQRARPQAAARTASTRPWRSTTGAQRCLQTEARATYSGIRQRCRPPDVVRIASTDRATGGETQM
jgi:hypothetical protein